uniref:AAA family ATPase n=1 Tax=Amycolatopsis sp. CA-096443 TaxID=3239919 RepID=UPI003F4905A8
MDTDAAGGDLLPMPCVVLMVGPSGAGKSSVAQRIAARTGMAVLSYDSEQGDGTTVQQAAVDRAHARLQHRCAAGLSSVVDGTHRQPDRRAAVRAISTTHGLPVVAVALRVSLRTCLANQHRRDRHVPDEHVRSQHAALATAMPGLLDKGYHAVVVLTEHGIAHLLG